MTMMTTMSMMMMIIKPTFRPFCKWSNLTPVASDDDDNDDGDGESDDDDDVDDDGDDDDDDDDGDNDDDDDADDDGDDDEFSLQCPLICTAETLEQSTILCKISRHLPNRPRFPHSRPIDYPLNLTKYFPFNHCNIKRRTTNNQHLKPEQHCGGGGDESLILHVIESS